MNKQRRKELQQQVEMIQSAIDDLTSIRDEEQEYLDNMPENFQEGERGQAAEAAVEAVDAALELLSDAIGQIEEAAGDGP